MALFGVVAEPESEVLREKIVRVYRPPSFYSSGAVSGGATAAFVGGSDGDGGGSGDRRGNRMDDWNVRFARGDVLLMTPDITVPSSRYSRTSYNHRRTRKRQRNDSSVTNPRECIVVDVGSDWLTVGVGTSWPKGLWESRKDPGGYVVRLDRATPLVPLNVQREGCTTNASCST